MPAPGLSLVGFITIQEQALYHLANVCIPADESRDALIAEWNAAKARLGAPIANAGRPDIQAVPAALQVRVQDVLRHPKFQVEWRGATIELVEIEPLLTHQLTVGNRLAHHSGTLSNPPTLDELWTLCLARNPRAEQIRLISGKNSLVVKARNPNVRILQGVSNQDFLGIQFGIPFPFVHVVRLKSRHYLYNGCHRAVEIRNAGGTHMPCIVRDITDHNAIGLSPPDTFDSATLDSVDPPSVGHFTQGRAHRVSLRSHSRLLYLNWAEHLVPDE